MMAIALWFSESCCFHQIASPWSDRDRRTLWRRLVILMLTLLLLPPPPPPSTTRSLGFVVCFASTRDDLAATFDNDPCLIDDISLMTQSHVHTHTLFIDLSIFFSIADQSIDRSRAAALLSQSHSQKRSRQYLYRCCCMSCGDPEDPSTCDRGRN